MMKTSRREFLIGCSSAIAAMAGSRLGVLGVAGAQPGANRETLVVVFLRGGMDGLSLIPPIAGVDRGYYEEARPLLKIPTSGPGMALPLDDQFGLHPAAASLHPLYQSGKLAVVHAVGVSGSRSHFDAMKYLELGTPGDKTTPDGWLKRHLQSSPSLPGTIIFPVLAAGATPPTSLLGSHEVVNMTDATFFQLGLIGHPSWAGGEQWSALRRMYQQGGSIVHPAGVEALNAAGLIESYVRSDYVPLSGANYPAVEFGRHLKLISQLIKADVGLRVATVDLGGWDTHEAQGNEAGGPFSNRVAELSDGLAAFYRDLDTSSVDAPINRVTVVVVSEFGRRVRENANRGTDHGTANAVLVLGGNVRGGIHGRWPGLHLDQRFDNADLAPTTDLRNVLSEVLIRRAANPKLGEVFPSFSGYVPLNVVTGPDLPPDYTAYVPVTPTDFAAVRVASEVVRLTWSLASGATNYRIERRDTPEGAWNHLVVLGAVAQRHDDTAAPAGTNPEYRLQAFNSHGDGAFVVTTTGTSSDPRAQWRLLHFGTSGNVGQAADNAVVSSDGMPNFVKYALGLDPRVAVNHVTTGFVPGRPRVEVTPGAVSLVYLRPIDRVDVRYEVLASTDLKNWTAIADESEGTGDGFDRRRATFRVENARSQFLKLNVENA